MDTAASSKSDPLSCVTPQDQQKFTKMAAQYEGAKITSELFGRRPRRFVILTGIIDSPANSPLKGTKRLRLIRHGEAEHNKFRLAEQNAGRTPVGKRWNFAQLPDELWDPLLTEKGEADARAAAEQVVAKAQDPELLVTSPLRRTCQTGLLAFCGAVHRKIPIMAHEFCRECYVSKDPSIWDAHRSHDELSREFPEVCWDGIPFAEGTGLEVDPHWWQLTSPVPGLHLEAGETVASHVERAYQFICWLMDRKEEDIAVVTHSLWLLALHHGVLDEEDEQQCQHTPKNVQLYRTGELRTIIVAERSPP